MSESLPLSLFIYICPAVTKKMFIKMMLPLYKKNPQTLSVHILLFPDKTYIYYFAISDWAAWLLMANACFSLNMLPHMGPIIIK